MTTSKQNPPTLAKSRKGLHPGVIVCFVLMGFVALLISSFLIWQFRLSSQMSARLSAIQNAGEPTTTRELDEYYAGVPEAENAAVVWMKGLEKLNPPYDKNQPTAWGKIKLPERGSRLGELQKASQILRDNEEAMKIFRTAARTSKSRYKVDLSGGPSVELPHLSAIKSAGSLLRLEALVAAQTGENDESAEAIRDVIGAAESLRAEPLLISQLVRFSLHSMAGLAAQSALNLIPLRESKLAMLQKAFEEAEDQQSIYRALVGERACSATYLLHPDQVPFPALSADPQQDQERAGGTKGLISSTMRMSGFFQRDGVFFLDAMATNLAVAQMPDPDRFKSRHAMDSLELKARKGYFIMSGLLLPALSKANTRDVENRARLRVAQTAMAVERYRVANGKLPATLEVLVPQFLNGVPLDPIDGEALRYKLLSKGYVIYSIGVDAQDDGGKPKSTDKKHLSDSYDLTFTVERSETAK